MLKYKVIITVIAFLLSIVFYFFFSYTSDINKQLNVTQNELLGLEKLNITNRLNNALQRYRGLYNLNVVGESDENYVRENLDELHKEIELLCDLLVDSKIQKEVKAVLNLDSQNTRQRFNFITKLIESNNLQIRTIADEHQLFYEPERESYLLIDMMAYSLPELMENSAKLRGVTSQLDLSNVSIKESLLINGSQQNFKHYYNILNTTVSMIEADATMSNAQNAIMSEYDSYKVKLDAALSGATPLSGITLFNMGSRLVEKAQTLYLIASEKLNKNLEDRVKHYKQVLILIYTVFAITLLLMFSIIILFYQRIKHSQASYEEHRSHKKAFKQLQAKLYEGDSLAEICNESLSFLANYYQVASGVIYLFNSENKRLELGATYHISPETLKHNLSLGEGLIGQNIIEPKIVESFIEESSEEFTVELGAIKAKVRQVITFPLIDLKHCVGTVQLVLFNKKKIDQVFLEKLYTLIASHIYKARKDAEINRYLVSIDKHVITSSTNTDGIITEVSQAFSEISGYSKEELIGQNHNIVRHLDMPIELYEDLWDTVTQGKIWCGEVKNRTKKGGSYWVDVTITPNVDLYGNISGYTAIRQDITDRKKVEEIAITDGLTQIFNRRHFDNSFPTEIKQSAREDTNLIFVLMDIDHFKQYNDIYGHQEGDNALITISHTLKVALHRPRDLVFRLGGEEFGLLYTADSAEKAKVFAEKVKKKIESLKIKHEGNSASPYVTLSMGLICIPPNMQSEPEALYKLADDMLYKAKKGGRNSVQAITVES